MRAYLGFFLRRHLLVNVITAAVLIVGATIAMRSQREGFPAVDLDTVVISARLPGASAEDVESKVVSPIEDALDEVDNIDEYNSSISANVATIVVKLVEGMSKPQAADAEDDIRRAVAAISDFPAEMRDDPVITRLNPGRIPVLEIALSGPSVKIPEAARRLELALGEVDALSSVTTVGVSDPEVRVLVDVKRAQQHGVALAEVMLALQRRSVSGTGGTLETARARKQVVIDGELRTLDEVREVVVRQLPGAQPVRVGDLARVERGRADDGIAVHTNGQPGASVVVRKRDGADILQAADAVRAVVEKTALPEGVDAVLVNDGSFITRNRLAVLTSNGVLGLVLVVVTLFVFLTRRTAFWVAVGVPTVLLGVVILMPFVGVTINLISVAGLVVVLGLLVDDAVVVAERIVFKQHEGLSPVDAAIEGAASMSRPVTASAITTILAFSPMLFLGGLPGKIAWNIPVVVILSLIVSLLECFTILPAHVSGGKKQEITEKRRFVVWLEERYARVLSLALRRRYFVLGGFLLLFVVTMRVVMPSMPFTLFPQDDSDALYLKVTMPPGTPIEVTESVVTALERQIPALTAGDLIAVTARVGHQDPNALDREVGSAPHEAVISALFKPIGRARTSAGWATFLGEKLVIPEGAHVVFEPRLIGPPVGRPVTVHVIGENDAARRRSAAAVAETLRQQPGVVDVEIDEVEGVRQIDLRPDWDKLAQRGVDAATLDLSLKAALYGAPVAEVREAGKAVEYRVQLDEVSRASLDAVLETPLRARDGGLLLLREVVRPAETPSVSTYFHRDGVRAATVRAGFAEGAGWTARSMGTWLQSEVFPALKDPAVRLEMGGEFTETKKTMGGMAVVGLLAVFGILLVVAVMLDSLLDAAFVVAVIPFGVVGVVLSFFAHGKPLSMFAMLGGIGLAGVVVNTSIVMVDAAKQRIRERGADDHDSRIEAMSEAVVERLRPILVTTTTTLGGVLPTAYGIGGYDAVLSPMSLALGWGLAFSTLVTLVLVPSLFAIAQDLRRLRLRRR